MKRLAKYTSLRNGLIYGLIVVLLASGSYILLTSLSPQLTVIDLDNRSRRLSEKIANSAETPKQHQLYIPKLGVEVSFQTGEANVLESGAWWRAPSSGNPKEGGNFVLAAHRFQMGWTPSQTARKSPFYNIDKLELGDHIVVDYKQQRYKYEIKQILRVPPPQPMMTA